jgi:DNA-binding transcriptional regulator YdaS (Cro superfamily)
MNQIKFAAELVGGAAKLASLLGVTPQAVAFWRDGKRRMPVEMCSHIERETKGAVTRQKLRPLDWMLIWPELVGGEAPSASDVAAGPLTDDPALNVELTRAEQAGLVKLPHPVPAWDGVERRDATVQRRAADRERDAILAAGQGS